MNDEMRRLWKEAVLVLVLSHHLYVWVERKILSGFATFVPQFTSRTSGIHRSANHWTMPICS